MSTHNYAFSKTTLAFYPYDLKDAYDAAGTWPSDAVDVPDETFAAFAFVVPPVGMMRGADADGFPAWVEIPPLTPEQILEVNTSTKTQLLTRAATVIAPLQDAQELGIATENELKQLQSWKAYRVAVNRVALNIADPAWPSAPDASE